MPPLNGCLIVIGPGEIVTETGRRLRRDWIRLWRTPGRQDNLPKDKNGRQVDPDTVRAEHGDIGVIITTVHLDDQDWFLLLLSNPTRLGWTPRETMLHLVKHD